MQSIEESKAVNLLSKEQTTPRSTLLRRIQVQGRDGRQHEFLVSLSAAAVSQEEHAQPLRLGHSSAKEEHDATSTFFRQYRDASSLVLTWLYPQSWLSMEACCTAFRAAVLTSGCWRSPVMAGHSLRFRPTIRKAAYVRHLRAMAAVARAFEDLRRFARSPASVFNQGASLRKIYNAEQRVGVVFPDEVRASFSLFDGQARSAWLRSEGVIGGIFSLLSLEQSVEFMLEEGCLRGEGGQVEFVPLAERRNGNLLLAAAVKDGRICTVKQLGRPKLEASSWSAYLCVQ